MLTIAIGELISIMSSTLAAASAAAAADDERVMRNDVTEARTDISD